MDAERFTHDELIAALQAATDADDPDAGLTGPELAEIAGIGVKIVHKRLKLLKAEGRLQVVRVRRERLDGVVTVVPGYRLQAESAA